MYASFFGLRELPFNNTPDPRYFYSTPDHEEALASLIYAISESRGFVLLTGEVGAGKTLMTRLMLRHFNDRIVFAGISQTQVTATDLLRCICSEFGIDTHPHETSADLLRRLQDFLIARFADGKPVVLMLDEAQALSRDAFEQVRMIGNVEADDAKLLQIVIVGQPELRERFEADDMRQLRQRMFRSFHLRALTREQTEGYILHRLSVGGAQYPERIFDSAAIDIIYQYSQGLPRLINTVCDNAMLSAYAADQLSVDGPFTRRVVEQMTSVAQGGPKFASPKVAPGAGIPQRRQNDANIVHHPAIAAEAPEIDPATAKAAQHLNEVAQRIGDDLMYRMSVAAERMNVGLPASQTRPAGSPAPVSSQPSYGTGHPQRDPAESDISLRTTIQAAAGVRENLNKSVADAEARVEQIARRAGRLEAALTRVIEQMDAAGERCSPVIAELRNQIADARAAANVTENARNAAHKIARTLNQQSTTSARLTTTLRKAFDRIERQADVLEERTGQIESGGVREGAPRVAPSHQRLAQRARHLTHVIDDNRSTISEIRATLTAATEGPAMFFDTRRGQRTRSRLSEQVRALSELIDRT
ncbi:MAG: AAA family ATPase [Phycisphaerales bacterium]|nr:AAA family ATPase [Phycisphaerales bacterium]